MSTLSPITNDNVNSKIEDINEAINGDIKKTEKTEKTETKFTIKTPSNEVYQQEYYKLIRLDKLLMLKKQRASNKLITIICECGTISNPNQITAHRKTNKHITLLNKSQSSK